MKKGSFAWQGGLRIQQVTSKIHNLGIFLADLAVLELSLWTLSQRIVQYIKNHNVRAAKYLLLHYGA